MGGCITLVSCDRNVWRIESDTGFVKRWFIHDSFSHSLILKAECQKRKERALPFPGLFSRCHSGPMLDPTGLDWVKERNQVFVLVSHRSVPSNFWAIFHYFLISRDGIILKQVVACYAVPLIPALHVGSFLLEIFSLIWKAEPCWFSPPNCHLRSKTFWYHEPGVSSRSLT